MSKKIKRRYFTARQRQIITERFEGICQACGKEGLSPLSTDDDFLASIDHVIPLSRGGTNDDDNIQLLCLPCNLKKGNMTMPEFIDYLTKSSELELYFKELSNLGVDSEVLDYVKSKVNVPSLHALLSPLLNENTLK